MKHSNLLSKTISSITFLLVFVSNLYSRAILRVNNQSDLENLKYRLSVALKSNNKDVYVLFASGQYEFNDNQIVIKDVTNPQQSVHFCGDGVVIIPHGKTYNNGDFYSSVFSVNNSWIAKEEDIEIWSNVHYADGLIEIVDIGNKLCKLKYKEISSPIDDISKGYILIPHWFKSSIYKIDKIESGFIFFTAQDLALSYKNGYNINVDYNYGGRRIRYRLCNVESGEEILSIINNRIVAPSCKESIRGSNAHSFLSLQNCAFNSVEISGFRFIGNSYAKYSSLIKINGMVCNDIQIRDCKFIDIRSDVITIENTHNVTAESNEFDDCYNNGVRSDNRSCNTTIIRNTFTRMGKQVQNTFCVVCQGNSFQIRNNSFADFGYGGVCIGLWHGHKQYEDCTGIVENNEFSFSNQYLNGIQNYGLMDSGAIYFCTRNNGTIVRHNYIHNFSGAGDNRGIFCDDGASNIQIYGNVITGIKNSYCIDSRRVASIEKKLDDIDRTNVNIVIKNNIVDGPIRFAGHEDKNNGCYYGTNYYLIKKRGILPKVEVVNVEKTGRDVRLLHSDTNKGRISLSSSSYKMLKRNPEWNRIKRLFN